VTHRLLHRGALAPGLLTAAGAVWPAAGQGATDFLPHRIMLERFS